MCKKKNPHFNCLYSCILYIRRDPSIKRTLCKKCNSLLIPGVTASLRIKSE